MGIFWGYPGLHPIDKFLKYWCSSARLAQGKIKQTIKM